MAAKKNTLPEVQQANVRKAVDDWFTKNFMNSVVSRDTTVYNLIHNAKPELVKSVIAALAQTNPSE